MEPDQLYGLPLDRFVPQRGALARALRADGRRAEAAEVAGLRKPTVAAWAVNQLVRTQAGAVEGLFEAGDALREAQADVLAGRGDGRTLRAAGERERAAVDGLVETARGLLTSEGHELGPATVERVADTLHAAALDEEAREQVRGGRLERELRHVGLGLGEGLAAAAASAPRAAKSPAPPKAKAAPPRTPDARVQREARADRERAARQRAEAERAERERAAAARKAARAAEAAARRRLERAERALRAAEQRRERAAQALGEADAALAAAREEAGAAADAHRRATADAS